MYVHLALCRLQRDCEGVAPALLESRPVSDGCQQLLLQALDVDPHCEFAYETLGTIHVQNGRLEKAAELFESAIAIAKTEAEMAHLISLHAAVDAQLEASKQLGIAPPLR